MRRATVAALAVLVALAGAVALAAFLHARDDAGLGADGRAAGPGVAVPAGADPRLRRGNVVLSHRDAADGRALRALAADVAGPPDPSLEQAGQAVLVERRAGQRARVVARALRRRLDAGSPRDPALREFVEAWLARASVE